MEAVRVQALEGASPRGDRALSRTLRLALIATLALAIILLVILTTATANTSLFQEHYPLLLGLTAGTAVAVFALVMELLRRLVIRYRRGQFGTRLMARMATAFVLMTVLPVALIFVVAVQFIGRSIESWFDVPVEQALESGLSLGRASLDSQMADLTQKARYMARQLEDSPPSNWSSMLNRLREQVGAQDALIASASGRIVTASGSQYAQLVPDLPPAHALRQARITRLYTAYEGAGDADASGPSVGTATATVKPPARPDSPPATAGGASPPAAPDANGAAVPPAATTPNPQVPPAAASAAPTAATGDSASPSSSSAVAAPDSAPAAAPAAARTGSSTSSTSHGYERGLRIRVVVPLNRELARFEETNYLQLMQPVPSVLASNAEAVQQGYAGYKALSATRGDLKKLYRITLSLIFFLTLFSAVAAAFLLAGWLVGPLAQLASATRSVAEGDFRLVKDYSSRGELGVLTRSFNVMTRQLQDARALVERNQRELEAANTRLESVLANLNAGVLVLDAELRLTLANRGADRILAVPLAEHLGAPLSDIPRIGALSKEIRAAFNEQVAAGLENWQRQFALHRANNPGNDGVTAPRAERPDGSADQTILARGSMLPERRVGYVIVIDDITEVISAQRALAWAEVARRLAHEIKNPLTPIQLSAERMERKLYDKLSAVDAEFLHRNAQTIVSQVAALTIMVDEFRDYARLPAARLAALNLNKLIDDVLHLYASTPRGAQIVAQLAPSLPDLQGDRTQLRQVIHNLLKNAIEATEKRTPPRIEVSTERLLLPDGSPAVRLMVRDNGEGFGPAMLARAFEPYVTTKSKGTGLGLAIVRKIVEEHGARIDVANTMDAPNHISGAQVSVLFTKLAKSVENPGIASAVR